MKEHYINSVVIHNFKSIRHLELTGFKKINLLIGRPNVGKSNFLEALGLFSLNYLRKGDVANHRLSDIVRINRVVEIFHDFGSDQKLPKGFIELNINRKKFDKEMHPFTPRVNYWFNNQDASLHIDYFERPDSNLPDEVYTVKEDLSVALLQMDSPYKAVKYYKFNPHFRFHKYDTDFLLPPYGENLTSVLSLNPNLAKEINYWFKPFGLDLDLDLSTFELKFRKKMDNFASLTFPYNSIADTLQRIIFHKTAVASNTNSILLFEEPEAHAFPPYIREFTQEVIHSETNQFFIATHSPIIVNDFLENAREDLAIFMVDYKDNQTVMRGLTADEIFEVHKYGIDLFFNNETYTV